MVASNMDQTEDTDTEDLDTETQMDATSGCESPVLPQSQKTLDRESQRTKSRRKRGGAEKRGRNPSSSKSVSPERPRGWRVSAATNTTSLTSRSPPETPVTNRERGRAGRNAATDAARNAVNAARANRARFSSGNQSRSPTRSRSRSPGEIPGTSVPSSTPTRGRKKTSVIWNHCKQKQVNNVMITYCNHCSSSWILSGSTSTALQHFKTIHSEKITEAEESQMNSGSEPTLHGAKTPNRQFKSYADMTKKVDHCSHRGRKINRKCV